MNYVCNIFKPRHTDGDVNQYKRDGTAYRQVKGIFSAQTTAARIETDITGPVRCEPFRSVTSAEQRDSIHYR